jgi:N-acetylmuramoyl-L-alanine amidase
MIPYLIKALIISLVFTGVIADASAEKIGLKNSKGIVVLDPGHGGNDYGVRGAGDRYEKVAALNLARMISDRLTKLGYHVVLTRTDDYGVDLSDRTAVANHIGADLFISLHAGGSFLQSVGGTSVYYFKEASASAPEVAKPAYGTVDEDEPAIPWDQLQTKYLASSMALAEVMHKRMLEITQDPGSSVQGAPLLVLKGADMPAVLIEFGYLTNPNEGKALSDDDYLNLLAKAMSRGIESFLSKHNR